MGGSRGRGGEWGALDLCTLKKWLAVVQVEDKKNFVHAASCREIEGARVVLAVVRVLRDRVQSGFVVVAGGGFIVLGVKCMRPVASSSYYFFSVP